MQVKREALEKVRHFVIVMIAKVCLVAQRSVRAPGPGAAFQSCSLERRLHGQERPTYYPNRSNRYARIFSPNSRSDTTFHRGQDS
jgi:hypothetical protein